MNALNSFTYDLKTIGCPRNVFADAAFGQDGRKMLIMLREGTTGLTNARKEFNALGGGVTTEDAKKAEAYNDAMQKIQESIRSIKFAALTPIMEKLTTTFTAFSNKFKNAQWRTEVIEKVKDVVTSLYQAFKFLGKGLLFFSQNIPEVIAGLALFKIAMFALNAVMIANPVALVAASIAALSVGIIYLMDKTGVLMPVLETLWTVFKRIGAGIGAVVSGLMQKFLLIPRAIMKMLSLIPSKLLPDGWDDSIKSAQQKLEEFNKGLKVDAKANIKYALHGPDEFAQDPVQTPLAPNNGYGGMLRHPAVQSKSQVDVRIKSDKPIEIVKAESDKHTEMNVDTFDFGWSY